MTVAEQLVLTPTPATQSPDSAERLARLRLARSQNVGPRTYAQLMRRYGTATRALEVLPQLAARGGKENYIICPKAEADAEMDAALSFGASLLLLGDIDYPRMLRTVEPAPPVLWVKGDQTLLNRRSVAIARRIITAAVSCG